jgi:hypothetical protein
MKDIDGLMFQFFFLNIRVFIRKTKNLIIIMIGNKSIFGLYFIAKNVKFKGKVVINSNW